MRSILSHKNHRQFPFCLRSPFIKSHKDSKQTKHKISRLQQQPEVHRFQQHKGSPSALKMLLPLISFHAFTRCNLWPLCITLSSTAFHPCFQLMNRSVLSVILTVIPPFIPQKISNDASERRNLSFSSPIITRSSFDKTLPLFSRRNTLLKLHGFLLQTRNSFK